MGVNLRLTKASRLVLNKSPRSRFNLGEGAGSLIECAVLANRPSVDTWAGVVGEGVMYKVKSMGSLIE